MALIFSSSFLISALVFIWLTSSSVESASLRSSVAFLFKSWNSTLLELSAVQELNDVKKLVALKCLNLTSTYRSCFLGRFRGDSSKWEAAASIPIILGPFSRPSSPFLVSDMAPDIEVLSVDVAVSVDDWLFSREGSLQDEKTQYSCQSFHRMTSCRHNNILRMHNKKLTQGQMVCWVKKLNDLTDL